MTATKRQAYTLAASLPEATSILARVGRLNHEIQIEFRIANLIALVLSLAIAQTYIGVSFAQTTAGPHDNFTPVAQDITGVVSIPSGKAILINGASVMSARDDS